MVVRIESGIPGLDPMIDGGFPKPSSILIGGEPGTGKTTFVMQGIFSGAEKGERGLYITAVSEPLWVVQTFLSNFKFYKSEYIERDMIIFRDIGKVVRENPEGTLEVILADIETYEPDRIVIDSLTPIKEALEARKNVREFLHDLLSYIKTLNCITLLTAEMTYNDLAKNVECYMVDSIIMLSYPEEEKVRKKYIEVLKMRGTKHTTGRQLLDITSNGISVQPGLR